MTSGAAVERDTATVWTTPSGAPERLVWGGRRFLVVAKPIPWVDRTVWWDLSPRVPVGGAAQLLEQPMWQVQAKALDIGELLILNLAVTDGQHWPITAVFD
ncbi:hypothetical protein [Nesterenkonia jeotgali]|uniref:Uncharacterized protein n=1 Tax=Nesterenkonia jeotgali TaxID=317018 RepID=A0A839FSR3_9MICC|nr:hypothetical protein [Nesterenkonia jeotgali]MBA8921362.1 hypothetical protein [Nesterenkonia jeotgali]